MATCPNCGSDNAKFRREFAGSQTTSSYGHLHGLGYGRRVSSRESSYKTVGFCPDCGYSWVLESDEPEESGIQWGCLTIGLAIVFLPVIWPMLIADFVGKSGLDPTLKDFIQKACMVVQVVWLAAMVIRMVMNPS